MKKTNLSDIHIAGIEAADHYLAIPETLTDEQDRALMVALKTVAKGATWWIGDYALSRQERKGEHYTTPLAECWGIDEGHIRKAAMVSRFFNPLSRDNSLTWKHHVEAIRGGGGIAAGIGGARAWLNKAKVGGWDVPTLRLEINRALALPPATEPAEPFANAFESLDTADKWATSHKEDLQRLDQERARNLLARISSLVELVDRLRAIAGAS